MSLGDFTTLKAAVAAIRSSERHPVDVSESADCPTVRGSEIEHVPWTDLVTARDDYGHACDSAFSCACHGEVHGWAYDDDDFAVTDTEIVCLWCGAEHDLTKFRQALHEKHSAEVEEWFDAMHARWMRRMWSS